MEVTRIESVRERRKKRVAAYIRVSTDMETQEGSYENQACYYEKKIRANPTWDFAGVYGDVESGTHSDKRDGLNQLIQDAIDMKVDLILCKSVSRWARNAVDAMDTIRVVKSHQVEIIFEQEGISTNNPAMLLQLNVAASIAQTESESISENMKWVYRNRARQGKFKAKRGAYFGFNTDDGGFRPDENAQYVKLMFAHFLGGAGYKEIAHELNAMGVRRQKGQEFTGAAVRGVLSNSVYVGDVEFGKTPSRNVITGELDAEQYHRYLENHHEGIIDRETWDAVQAKIAENKLDLEGRNHQDQRVYDLLTEGVKNKDIAVRLEIPIWQVNASVRRLKEKKWI